MTPLEEAKKSYVQHRPSAYITKIKKNKNGELDELVMITSFLDGFYTDIPITQRLKHYLSNELFIYRCELCSEPLAYRKKSNASYNKTCGSEICSKKQNYLSTSRTIKEKYGVSNISQTQTWKYKVSDTNYKKYGVQWITQTEKLIQGRRESWESNKEKQINKRIETNCKKYGTRHPLQNSDIRKKLIETIKKSQIFKKDRIEKIKSTNFKKYGTDWYTSTNDFKEKVKQQYLSKYGVTHNSHLAITLDRRWKHTSKNFVFPSGKTVVVQGYEHKCINELIQNGYSESDIIIGNKEIENEVGLFLYTSKKDEKIHRYYPDIFIKPDNKIIEVKSKYTLSKDIYINEKKKSVLDAGYNYELKLYD